MRLLFFFKILGLAVLIAMATRTSAKAEYRAFVLRIEKKADPSQYREIISNLDPQHYIGYYPINRDERIRYTNTWMCPGRTYGFQKICDNPRAALLE